MKALMPALMRRVRESAIARVAPTTSTLGTVISQAPAMPPGTRNGRARSGSRYRNRKNEANSIMRVKQLRKVSTWMRTEKSKTTKTSDERLSRTIATAGVPYRSHVKPTTEGSIRFSGRPIDHRARLVQAIAALYWARLEIMAATTTHAPSHGVIIRATSVKYLAKK